MAFDMSTIFGLGTDVPGDSFGPYDMGGFQSRDPRGEFVDWGGAAPDAGMTEIVNFMRQKMAQGRHEEQIFNSNEFIQTEFSVSPWLEDDAHKKIREGMPCWTLAQKDHASPVAVVCATLAKLNLLLRTQQELFNQAVQTYGGDYAAFDNALRVVPEKVLLEAVAAQNQGRPPKNPSGELNVLLTHYKKPVFQYLTIAGITNTWLFDGGVLTVSDPTSAQDMFSGMGLDHQMNINVVMAKRVLMGNVWGGPTDGGDVKSGSKLYFVLRRRYNARDDSYGEYQFFPESSRSDANLPMRARRFLDRSGTPTDAFVQHVGTVTRYATENPVPEFRRMAAGVVVTATLDSAMAAHAKLPQIEVQIGM